MAQCHIRREAPSKPAQMGRHLLVIISDSAAETSISAGRGATLEVRTHPLTQFQSRVRLIPFGRQGFATPQ